MPFPRMARPNRSNKVRARVRHVPQRSALMEPVISYLLGYPRLLPSRVSCET